MLTSTDGIAGLELYWICFWELRSSVSVEDPIPWSEREMWARAHRLDYDQRERLHQLVSAMDSEFRKWKSKQTEHQSKGEDKRIRRGGKGGRL